MYDVVILNRTNITVTGLKISHTVSTLPFNPHLFTLHMFYGLWSNLYKQNTFAAHAQTGVSDMRRPLLLSSCLSHIHLFISYSTDCLDVARDFAHLLACLLGYGDRQQDNRFIWPSVMGKESTGFSY